MLSISTGRIKTFVLMILISSSLVLCGSLWFDNYHGFSSFFAKFSSLDLTEIFRLGKEDVQNKFEKIILPSKVIVNNGEEGHWILYPTEPKHEILWRKTKVMLKAVIEKDSQIKANIIEESEWNSLITKSSVICFFDYPLNNQMLSMLYKIEFKKLREPDINISSIALIRFGENIILYTKGTEGNIVTYKKYYFSDSDIASNNILKNEAITDKDFNEIFDDSTLIKYALMKEAFSNIKLKLNYQEDVFIPVFSFSDTRRKSVKFREVEFSSEILAEDTKQSEQIVEKFFEGWDYSKFIKKDGSHIFIDEKDNTLKIYPEGVFEFESGFQDENKMDFKSNFELALQKVEAFGGLDGLYLRKFQIIDGKMKFMFDYAVNGVPVGLRNRENADEASSAVEVTVSPDQIKYRRSYHNFVVLDKEYNLMSNFESIINAVFEKAGPDSSSVMIEEISLEYMIYKQNKNDSLPVWLVKFKTKSGEKWVTAKATEDRR